MKEMMAVVDEKDRTIGKMDRDSIMKKNLIHRGTAIFVFNSKGHILVHQRNWNKKYYPGFYDAIIGGGLRFGETYLQGAKREVEEEIGVKDAKLKFLFKNRFRNEIDNNFAAVYRMIYDEKINFNKREFEHGSFITIRVLRQLMRKKRFAPDFRMIFSRYMRQFHG
jgi:isopentenyldiphosphate isomerase